MRTTAIFQNTDKYEVAITMTMSLGDWKALRKAMNEHMWPASELSRHISDIVSRAEAQVYVPARTPDGP